MKKQRGLKRYYKNLAIQDEFNKMTWLDFNNTDILSKYWHLHFDNKGYGNNSFKKRKLHLEKLFRHFEILVEKTKQLKHDFQLYAIILDFDSSSDALFFHKPSSNGNAFPFKISDLSPKSNLTNHLLDEYLKNKILSEYKILYGQAEENFCLIYKENVGQSFE
jgi:hypothetical protein